MFRWTVLGRTPMLALLALVDEYVTVSNTNVYLMVGLGRSPRVIVPFPPDWRWLHAGETSPWFRAVPLYRQTPGRGLEEVLGRLAGDLQGQG